MASLPLGTPTSTPASCPTIPDDPIAFLNFFAAAISPPRPSPSVQAAQSAAPAAPTPAPAPASAPHAHTFQSPTNEPSSFANKSADNNNKSFQTDVAQTPDQPPQIPQRRLIPTAIPTTNTLKPNAAFEAMTCTSNPTTNVGAEMAAKKTQSAVKPHATTSCGEAVPSATPHVSAEYLVSKHASALMHLWRDAATPPSRFVMAFATLISAHRLTSVCATKTAPFPKPGVLLSAYTRSVITALQPILHAFPPAITQHVRRDDASRPPCASSSTTVAITSATSTTATTPAFPAGAFAPQHPAAATPAPQGGDTPLSDTSTRLRSNLEAAWDQLLVLHRKYRGDIATAHPAHLDLMDALRALAALHPANIDAFATRLLAFITRCARAAVDGPERLRRLDERIASRRRGGAPGGGSGNVNGNVNGSGGGNSTAFSGRGFQREDGGGGGAAVVLHRVPHVVRSAFAAECATHLFFLDFLTAVDSARLHAALAPRLAAAASHAVTNAAAATSASAFTDAVLEARLFAMLLSVVLHFANWPHSPSSLTGQGATTASPLPACALSMSARALRKPVCSAEWTALFDVARFLRDAVACKEVAAVLAATAVADVFVRFAAVDPVARETEWFRNAVETFASVSVVDSDGNVLPVVRVLVGEAVCNGGVVPDRGLTRGGGLPPVVCDVEVARAVVDARFMRLVCPVLEDLRREFATMADGSVTSRGKARRITPQAASVKTHGIGTQKGLEVRKANGTGDTAMSDGEGGEDDDLDDDGVDNDEDEDDPNGMQSALRREFFARIDGRVRELVGVVAAARPESAELARKSFVDVVTLLYPTTPQTVAAVAAEVCARRVKSAQRERQADETAGRPRKGKVRQRLKRVPALEEKFVGASLSGKPAKSKASVASQ